MGINVASPTQALDVSGTGKATSFSGDGSSLAGVVGQTTGTHNAQIKDANGNTQTETFPMRWIKTGNKVDVF